MVRPRDDHATPAEILENGTDYMPTDRRVLFGHHFAAIAGAGPLVGPVLATRWVTCRGPFGSSSARCSPAVCRTAWCWFDQTARPFAGDRWPEMNWALSAGRRHRRGTRDHGDPSRSAGTRRGQCAGGEPVGRVLHRDDHPDRRVHGPLFEVLPPRPGVRGVAHRRGTAAACGLPAAAGSLPPTGAPTSSLSRR